VNDYTRLVRRLTPKADGDPVVRWRVATVETVETDGTVTVNLGDSVVSAYVLESAVVALGDIVHVAIWEGDLVVLGRVRVW